MAANKRPRKKYAPRAAAVCTPLEIATHRAGKIDPKSRAELVASARAAFDRLKRCERSKEAWQELADVLNISEALCGLRIAGNLLEMVKLGHAALAAQITRYSQGRGWALYGHEVASIDDAIWVYGVQVEHCSAGEALEAVSLVKRRCLAAQAGNGGPGCIVHAVDLAAA